MRTNQIPQPTEYDSIPTLIGEFCFAYNKPTNKTIITFWGDNGRFEQTITQNRQIISTSEGTYGYEGVYVHPTTKIPAQIKQSVLREDKPQGINLRESINEFVDRNFYSSLAEKEHYQLLPPHMLRTNK
ncbi:MAG: hypothetical protein KKC26_04445 [Nanoarchaeota archaeon]|nr:hypothetical protein [Nanoarchaeota archaeon]MBU1850764.1 hypothetical protein [Nanoarchaeota archaeon]